MPDLITASDESPFEALRRVDDEGEYWSAREMEAPLGYQTWENFSEAIRRARISAELEEGDSAYHFRDVTKVTEGGRWGTHTVADVRMTRHGAHLLAMNGDVDKPEIKAAQRYFSFRTREAELLAEAPLDEIEVAERYLASLKRIKALAAEKALAEAERDEARGDLQLFEAKPEWLSVGQCANTLGIGLKTFYGMLRDAGVVFEDKQQGGHRIYQRHLDRGWGEARWEKWANGQGSSWTPYFTRAGLTGVRKALGLTQKGLSS